MVVMMSVVIKYADDDWLTKIAGASAVPRFVIQRHVIMIKRWFHNNSTVHVMKNEVLRELVWYQYGRWQKRLGETACLLVIAHNVTMALFVFVSVGQGDRKMHSEDEAETPKEQTLGTKSLLSYCPFLCHARGRKHLIIVQWTVKRIQERIATNGKEVPNSR